MSVFVIGQHVDVLWPDDGLMYAAIITAPKGGGAYKVKFMVDGSWDIMPSESIFL